MPADFPVTELGQFITGAAPGRVNAAQVTLFDSVGFAVEDFSALNWLQAAVAPHFDLSEQLDMLAEPDSPRDLFGMYLRAEGVRA